MEKYNYTVTLNVAVEAFSEDDAWDAMQDLFGAGVTEGAVTIESCEWEYTK